MLFNIHSQYSNLALTTIGLLFYIVLWLKYHLQKPEKGFDPVPKAFAEKYAANEYKKIDSKVIDFIKTHLGDFENKTLLDLGAGPGQYNTLITFSK